MEKIIKDKIYFIYSQKGKESNIANIEENNNIKIVDKKDLHESDDYISTIYCLELSNNLKGKPYAISLINKNGQLFYKNIYSKDTNKFKYEMIFESFYGKEINPLNQITLNYKEQFFIFEKYLKEDYKSINDLFLDSINDLSKDEIKELNYEFLLILFFEIFKKYSLSNITLFKNTIKKYFEDLNYNILEKESNILIELQKKPKLDINQNDLKLLSDNDPYSLRNKLIFITGDKEEINIKIDVFLCFYYIYYKPNLFLSFVDSKNDKFKDIKSHLLANKVIFKDFNSKIFNLDLIENVQNSKQLSSLISNFVPNMVEVFKIITDYMVFLKLVEISIKENKLIRMLDLCKPQKTDDIEKVYEYFNKYIDLFVEERIIPVYCSQNFYLEYCKLFLNEDFEKIKIVQSMLKYFNNKVSDKDKIKIDKEINKYYHDTGMFLITKKKLINYELFQFLKKDPYFEEKENIIPIDIISEGIIFEEKKRKFVQEFLNNEIEDFQFKEFFGNLYYKFMRFIFDKFKTPRDMLVLRYWDIPYKVDNEVLENFIYAIKRVWLWDPKNHMYGLEKLIANAFGKASIKMRNYFEIISDLEKKILYKLILPIYTLILYKEYELSEEFREHIVKYIHSNTGKSAIDIWYILNTIDDDCRKNEYLEENLKEEYAVKPEDFIDYPAIVEGRIILFTNLYNARYFINNLNLTKMPYYTKSLESKDNLNNLKYLDSMRMYKNLNECLNLLVFFFPGESQYENQFNAQFILICFSEKCEQAKKHYDSLNRILNYWNKFFKNIKNNEIIKLNNIISKYEKSSLNECEKLIKDSKEYLTFLPEAETGEKLKESIFFMSIYESNENNFKNNEIERYNNSFKKFNELKQLGINSDINLLEKDLKNNIVEAAIKNKDKLKQELIFIKKYFCFDSGKNNFNIIKLRKSLSKLVKEYQKEKGLDDNEDKEEDILDIDENENNDNKNKIEQKKDNIIIIKTSDKDIIEDEFNYSQKQILLEKENLIRQIKKLAHDFILTGKKNKNNNQKDYIYDKFIAFYKKLFETNYGLGKLNNKEFVIEIRDLSKKLFLNSISLGLMNNIENYKDKKILLIISEFVDIIETFEIPKDYKCKDFFLPLLKILKELYDSPNDNDELIKSYIDNFISFLKKYIKNNQFYDLLIEILIKEKRKYNNVSINNKLINFAFGKKSNLGEDLMPIPFIDEIFSNEFNFIINDNNKKVNNDIQIEFENDIPLNKINELIGEKENKILEEKILFYFETKIMAIFDKKYNNNEKELFNDKNINYLDLFLKKLESKNNNNIQNSNLMKLYSIAFIKCFLNKLAYFSVKYNEPIANFDNIVNKIKGGSESEFRTSIKIYFLKLFFENLGNYCDFKNFNFNTYKIDYLNEKNIEKIINNNEIESKLIFNKYGFDYIIFPFMEYNEEKIKNFAEVIKDLINIKEKNSLDNEVKLLENINKNKNIDFLYCCLLNIHFSFFYEENYYKKALNREKYSNINDWISRKITGDEFEILKNNELIKKILSFFVEDENENIFKKDLDYKKLLCLLISTRYVLKTLSNDNKDGIFYNLILNPIDVFSNCQTLFELYLKDFDTFTKMERDISYLTYKIINYIILSHLYYGYLLGKLDLNNNKILSILKKDDNNNEENYLLKLLYNEFNNIIDDILNLIGIKKNIIYLNSIFEEISNRIIKINLSNDKDYLKSQESDIDIDIKNKINKFDEEVKDYYESIKLIKEQFGEDIKDIGKDILLETNDFYNNEPNSKYPFISYFTSTNFCTFEDFEKQRLYLINDEYDNKNYPIIDYILSKDNIIQSIIDLLPKINQFINKIYNKLVLKTPKNQINMEIKNKIDKIDLDNINSLNESLQKFLNIKGINNIKLIISESSKLFDVINIEDEENNLFKIYNIMIEEYNKFLSKINIYKNNKKMLEPIIIQNASQNDYITFTTYTSLKNDNNNEDNIISAKERLCQIIYLYSDRNRVREQVNQKKEKIFNINISDGGKIIYDYDLIEKILQKEFILGKKIFSNVQKTFIFSNNIFSNKRSNLLIDLNKKYPQKKIDNDAINNLENIFDNSKNKESILINYYYNILYIIIFLMEYEKDKTYDLEDITINDILKIIENNNFKNNDDDMKAFLKNDLSQSLFISHLLPFYEFVELKAFEYLTKEIKQQLNQNDVNIVKNIKEKILNHFNKKNNNLIKKEELINGIKKYIIRYCLGDYEDKNKILDKINNNFKDIFKRSDIWEEKIFNIQKFKDESNELININKEENCIIKYCLAIIFGFEVQKKQKKQKKPKKSKKKNKNKIVDDENSFSDPEEIKDEEDEEEEEEEEKEEEEGEEDEIEGNIYRRKQSKQSKYGI